MTHIDIYKFFITLFPIYNDAIDVWFPNGKGSIRVRLKHLSEEFIFTYVSEKEWDFETLDYHMNKSKGEKK